MCKDQEYIEQRKVLWEKPPPRVLFKISKLALKPCPVILLGMGKSSQASSYIAFPVWLKSWLLKSSLFTISLFNFFKNAK